MIRTSSHTMKYANTNKIAMCKRIIADYKDLLQKYIGLIYEKKLPLKTSLSSTALPTLNAIENANWKTVCYRDASATYRKSLAKYRKSFKGRQYHKPFVKLTVKIAAVCLNHHLWNIKFCESKNGFDAFVKIFTPYHKSKGRYFFFNVPIKLHRVDHYLKEQGFELNTQTVMLQENLTLTFFWEKEEPEKIKSDKAIGVDCGFKKLLTCSDGTVYGEELKPIYDKITRKKHNSKAYKRALKERNYATNKAIKNFYKDHKGCGRVICENLKYVKEGKKFNRKLRNVLQRWSYPRVLYKLTSLSEMEGFQLIKVNPAYTSQRCHLCNNVDKSSRQGEVYHCKACGQKFDADYNAAVNILRLGVYGPRDSKG